MEPQTRFPTDVPPSATSGYARLFGKVLELIPARLDSPSARAVRYAVALALVGGALGTRQLIGPAELGMQFLTFFPAVALTAIFAGFGPAMLASAISALLATVLYMPPYGAWPLEFERATVLSNLVFLLDAVVACGAIQAMHSYYRNLRLANERLVENRKLMHSLVEGTTDAVFLKDSAGHYVYCNGTLLQLMGKTREEVSGLDAFSLWPAGQARAMTENDAQVMSSQQVVTFEESITPGHGPERYFLTTKGPVFDSRGRVKGLFGIARDISGRKQLEATLKQERALLTNLLNTIDAMLVYLDCDFNFVWVNQAYADACKMAPAAMIGKNHFALYPHAENEAIFRGVRDTGLPVFYKDKPFEFPDQPERGITYWDWSLAPDKEPSGSVAGLVFSLRETTSHIRALQAVRESEGRFAALADAAPVLIWMSGTDKQCTWFNRQWLEFTGRTMAQELGNGWAMGIHPDDAGRCLEIYNQAFERREAFSIDYRLRAATDDYRWLIDHGAPHYSPDGEFLGYIGTCADITERRQAEDALRDNEQKLKLFIEEAPTGIAMLDREMRYLAVSRRFLEDYHIADTTVIGRCHYDIFRDIPTHWRTIHRRCLAGETLRCDEDPFIRADGSVKWFRWEIRPWFSGASETGGVIIFAEDISARKQADDELRAAQADAEQANNAKSRFLAAASHDLRQPLSALSLYVGMLKGKLPLSDTPLLHNMTNCVSSLSELLTDLLDLSKLDAGVVRPEISDFAVADLLASLNSLHAPEARLKGLRWHCRSSSLNARTDPVLFRRIVGNLLTNAIRYTERGGVLIGCRRRQGKIWIEVWDSGIGIPADKIGEIFEEFRQLGNEERNRGSGLGLAIAAKAAALLDLQIRVRSQPGKGSMFAVELPLGKESSALARCEPERLQLRIALVDDNPIVLNAMIYALTGMGHQVVAAATGIELIERLGKQAPDIVISDFRLAGGQTGFDVIAAVRASCDEDLPALLITGDTDPQLMRSMADRGIVVQHKPVDIEALQVCIEQVTRRTMEKPL